MKGCIGKWKESLSLILSSINILFFCLFLNSHSLKRWSTGPSLGGMKIFFILIMKFFGKNIFLLSSSISRSVTILLMQALFHNEGTVWERKVGWELRVWDKEKYTGIVRQEWCIHFFPTKNHMHPDSWCIMGLEICSFRNWFCLVFSRPFHTSSDLLGDLTTSSWGQISWWKFFWPNT